MQLINVKMPIVGILTFISMIIKTSESSKARKVFVFQHFSFYEQFQKVLLPLGLISIHTSVALQS